MTPQAAHEFLAEVRRDRDALVQKVAELDALISGILAYYPADASGGPGTSVAPEPKTTRSASPARSLGPRRGETKELLTAILETFQGRWLTALDVAVHARERGWGDDLPDPLAVVKTSLRRMESDPRTEVERMPEDHGRGYLYRIPSNAESAVPAALSVVPIRIPMEGGEADGTGDHRDHDPNQGHRDHAGGAPSVAEG